MNSIFSFELSRQELHWLASAFSLLSLPFPSEDWKRRPITPADLESGFVSLQKRGLAKYVDGWQIDRLPAGIARWLSTAPAFVRVERFERKGASRLVHLFTASEQVMSLEILDEIACFTIFSDHESLYQQILTGLGIPIGSEEAGEIYELAQPTSFLDAAWKHPHLIESMLRTTAISSECLYTGRSWISKLDWYATLRLISLELSDQTPLKTYLLCGSQEGIWGGPDRPAFNVRFVPRDFQDLRSTLTEFLTH